jgi:hypothetical protein
MRMTSLAVVKHSIGILEISAGIFFGFVRPSEHSIPVWRSRRFSGKAPFLKQASPQSSDRGLAYIAGRKEEIRVNLLDQDGWTPSCLKIQI